MEMAAEAVKKPNPFMQRVSYDVQLSGLNGINDKPKKLEERNLQNTKMESLSKIKEDFSVSKDNSTQTAKQKVEMRNDQKENECNYYKEFIRNNRHLECCSCNRHGSTMHCNRIHILETQSEKPKSPIVQISTGVQVDFKMKTLNAALPDTSIQYEEPVKLKNDMGIQSKSKEQKIQSKAAPVINDVSKKKLFRKGFSKDSLQCFVF